jgi:hypothetical protein
MRPHRRTLRFETLEGRQLLAAEWHNSALPSDVSNDEWVSPRDVLLIVQKLNDPDGRQLPIPRPTGAPYFDVNADGFLSPIDALLVLNALNAETPMLFVTLANDTQLGGGTNLDWVTADESIRGRTQFALPRDTLFAGWDIASDADLKEISSFRRGNDFAVGAPQITELLGAPLANGARRLTVVLRRSHLELARKVLVFTLDPNEQ